MTMPEDGNGPAPAPGADGHQRSPTVFRDRCDAGRRLAASIERMLPALKADRPVVLALPRGGVPVAAEVATVLDAPLDVILVRKLGVPHQPELAVGAIGEGGVRVLNEGVLRAMALDDRELAAVEDRERAELERRAAVYRRGRPGMDLRGHTAVVVDDGIATGSTAHVACEVARAHGATRVVLAAPVIPRGSLSALTQIADHVVFVEVPEPFFAIGQWYDDFTQTSDSDVVSLLDEAAARVVARRTDPV